MTNGYIDRRKFLQEYRHIRHAEGRGSSNSQYYCLLPSCDPNDPNADMWATRAKTYSYFVRKLLEPLEACAKRPLDVLDLGAGNCWLSHRLSVRSHEVVAVDIFNDDQDGLQAAHHYPTAFRVVEADFDDLPLPSRSFDIAVFNASFHYSVNYLRTLSEVRRVLRPSGYFAILDTPVYRLKQHGDRMVKEKHSNFIKRYGFASDALPSMEFLDVATINKLRDKLKIDWQILKPWYGWRWHLRPLDALLNGRRPPSKFWILVGRFQLQ